MKSIRIEKNINLKNNLICSSLNIIFLSPDKNLIYEINGILPKIIKTIETYSILALSKNPID